MTDFDEYIKDGNPSQREKSYAWKTAIGLQDVDGLKPSEYLVQTAKQNIDGDITIEEAKQLIDSYYKSASNRHDVENDRTEEADKVSARIAVFMIKYLKTLGFNVVNHMFAQNSWYFRNALVRANYSNLQKGITETTVYLERFFRSMLLGEEHSFRNRELHIEWKEAPEADTVQSANETVQSANSALYLLKRDGKWEIVKD